MKFSQYISIILFVCHLFFSGCVSEERKQFIANLKEGERLAKIYCTSCHFETPPKLLDKKTWLYKIIPQMGPRLGMFKYKTLIYERISPGLMPSMPALAQDDWEKIVDYIYFSSPDILPLQDFPQVPQEDCPTFEVKSFTRDIASSSIITMIKVDDAQKRVFASDAINNLLLKFDYQGNLLDSTILTSPPTAINIDSSFLDITLSGILHPNNLSEGEIVRYANERKLSKQPLDVLIDSLFRPVASIRKDFNYDGVNDYLVCEYGNDIGRLVLYFGNEQGNYDPFIIENMAGSIMIKTYDFNQDGFEDIAALFAQGDERIMIYYNDGEGNFLSDVSRVARFPAVYGSMYFDLHDFNNDGFMDIIYVNGDNFDFSDVLKPYHGIRILENDGENNFEEKYFFPIYGAGRVEIADFDLDDDQDIVVVSNFADMEKNPERGIIFLENTGLYEYKPYSFEAAAQNQWNTMGVADIDADGDLDVLVGAMNLNNVLIDQGANDSGAMDMDKNAILLMENKTK